MITKFCSLCFSFFILNIASAFSTGQESQILFMDGVKWELLNEPISTDSTLYVRFKNFLPKDRAWNTSNWDGYTGEWEIKDDKLYLRKVIIKMYKNQKEETQEVQGLDTFFADYNTNNGILASWFDRKIRLGKGKVTRYFHGGFDRNYEEECVLTVKDGVVLDKVFYRNHRKEGIKLEQIAKIMAEHNNWKEFPEMNGKRMIVSLSHWELASDGHFINCKIKIYLDKAWIEDENNPIIIAVKKRFKEIFPWEVLYLNGAYGPEYPYFTFPIVIKNIVNKTTM